MSKERDREHGAGPAWTSAPGASALGGSAAPEAPAGLEARIRRLEQEAADRAALVDSLARRVAALEAAAEGGV